MRKYKIQLLDTGLVLLKTALKKVVHKAGKFLENKITDAAIKSKDDKIVKPDENPRNVEETIIPTEKRDDKLRRVS